MPPRAGRPGDDPQKGTAILRGYVIAADSGVPVRRAVVRAMSQDGRGGGMTTTDADGRFEIKELLGGKYSLSVSKAGFVSTQYGQRRADQQGTTLEILDGQLVDKIGFSLPRGGVITGRVLDEFGEPIAGAQMTALRSRYFQGSRRLMPSGNATTDDIGGFRLFGLAPGDYYVSGALRDYTMNMPGTATATGMEGYAPTYYPGTPNAAEAQRVTVKVGAETTNVTFSLAATKLARITGRVVSSTGEPVVQAVVMVNQIDRQAFGMGMGFGGGATRSDGSFQLTGISSGSYNLIARPRTGMDPNAEFGEARVTVAGEDVDGVLIVTGRGALARGIVRTDDNSAPSFRPELVSIFAQPIEPEVMFSAGNAKVSPDWTFEMTGLSGRRRFSANVGENPDWSIKAIILNGQDITDGEVEFVPGQVVEGFELVLTRRRTELSGAIVDDNGKPDTNATVVAFAQDSKRWTGVSRYVRTARPNQDGRYTLRVVPEDYFVIAVRDIEPGEWQDPEVLDKLRESAQRVSFNEGETKVQDLKTIRR